MKFFRFMFTLCILLHMGMDAMSQIIYTDISTGRDSVGNWISVMSDDPRWWVKTPLGSFRHVKVGTGVVIDTIYTTGLGTTPQTFPQINYQPINPNNKGWLTPFPWTTAEVASTYFGQQPGDMKFSSSDVEVGEYIYKVKFKLAWPACKQPVLAHIDVRVLTALDSVSEILLNGYPEANLANMETSTIVGDRSELADHLLDQANSLGPYYYASTYPGYNISLNVQHLINGDNWLYIVAHKRVWPGWGRGTAGFLCDADLVCTYGANTATVPTFSMSGSNVYLCSNDTPTLDLALSNLGSAGAAVTVTASNSSIPGSAFPYNGSISYGAPSWSLNLDPNYPSAYTVTLTNNDANNPCVATKIYHTYPCNVVSVHFNSNPPNMGVFTGSGDPVNAEEKSIPGFETKWMLEELDQVSSEPLYRIINPRSWDLGGGESNKFFGFTAENSYTGDVHRLDGNPDDEGTFFEDRVYRITRSYRSDDEPDWADYSVTIGPGYDDITSKDKLISGLNTRQAASRDIVSVYPNPGNDVFKISMNDPGQSGSMIVYDVVGKKVQSISCQAGKYEYTLDLSGSAKGVYFLHVPGKNVVQKIMVE